MAFVSVVIPTYNRPEKVARAVSSVLNQTYPDFEVIVVDDGSNDNTEEYLKIFYPKITFIRHKANLGVSAARNTGISASKSPFIAFLDSDDYWLPKKLETQVGFFNSCSSALACQVEETWIRNGKRVNPRIRHIKKGGYIFEPSLKLCLISPSSVMLKRCLFDEVGLFDEGLPVCEDYDLWLRITCLHPVHLIKEFLVVREGGHPDQLSSSLKGMDRFRIEAIVKLLESGRLNKGQISAALKELSVKCRIYGNGCIRRNRKQEGRSFLQLPEQLKRRIENQACFS